MTAEHKNVVFHRGELNKGISLNIFGASVSEPHIWENSVDMSTYVLSVP